MENNVVPRFIGRAISKALELDFILQIKKSNVGVFGGTLKAASASSSYSLYSVGE